ncbi:MAG: MarR family transcriptional regulator, partial [Saprospiraceae bacterium]
MSKKNLKNDYHKAHNNILHTASWLNLHATQSLKRFGVSPQQFNVLRILNEVHPKPATVKMLTERMIDKMSNASRLVEK